jgi:predicted transposase YbfD/YdcC
VDSWEDSRQTESSMQAIRELFGDLDPRDQNARHDFCELLFIAFAAVLCGARNCTDFARFAQAKEAMLREILQLGHGLPSHDTFSTVFRHVDPKGFAAAFAVFTRRMSGAIADNRQITINGKSMRGAFETGKAHAPRMMVTAWGTDVRLSLAAVAAPNGSETKAALELLGLIDLNGTIVTADAAHCSHKTAEAITRRGGDYVLALKGNQGALHADATALAATIETPPQALARTEEKAHGRSETRIARVIGAHSLGKKHRFPGLVAIGEVTRERTIGGKTSRHTWLYVLSRPLSAVRLLEVVRGHWDIENGLHWRLDVIFGEDAGRTRKDHGPENLALLRRYAVNAFNTDKTKDTMRGKMMRAGWNDSYLFSLMTHMR